MNKILSFILMMLAFQVAVLAQIPVKESDVPEPVKSKLPNLFPGVSGVSWTKVNADYCANFSYDNMKVVSRFAESGRWINSESEYKAEDCPRTMQKHITSTFSDLKLSKIIFSENKDVSEYRVELTDTVTAKPVFAFYDVSGVFLRKSDSQGNDTDIQLQGANERGKLAVHSRELPSAVNSYIIINYSQYTIRESYIVNNEKYQNAYYVVLGKADAKEPVELWFDYQGTPISTGNAPVNNTPEKDPKNKKKPQARTPYPQSKVPAAAVDFFTKKELKAEEVRWDTIGNEYVVSYYNPTRSTENKMYFDKKGVYVKTATTLDPKNLLPMIQTYLGTNYPDLEIESAESVIGADKKKYTLVKIFSMNWMNDPMVFHEIYFATSGRLEKEILADFEDAEDQYLNEKRENKHEAFNDFTAEDDLSLEEGNLVDGQQVSYKELPSSIVNYMKANYPEYTYDEGMIMNDDGVLKYSVFLKREGYKGKKNLLFDLKGKFLKAEDL